MPSVITYRHGIEGGEYCDFPAAVCLGVPPWGFTQGQPVWQYPQTPRNLLYRNRTWNRTANYELRLLAGDVLPTNTYTDEKLVRGWPIVKWGHSDECALDPTNAAYQVENARGRGWFNANGLTDSSPNTPAWVIADAKLKCLAKAKDLDINIPVLFAEGRQTIGLLRDNLSRIGNFASYLYLGKWRRALKELGIKPHAGRKPQTREFASRVLEYKYGWMPLLQDCYGAANELVETFGGKPPSCTVRAQAYHQTVYSNTSGWLTVSLLKPTTSGTGATAFASSASRIVGRYRNDRTTSYVSTAGLLVEAEFNQMPTNLGLQDPALVLWEKTPFSFVFDWFVSVGDYLNAMTALRGLKVLRGFSSSLIVQDAVGTVTDTRCTRHDSIYVGTMRENRRNYSRSSWSGSLPPLSSLVKPLDSLGLSQVISSAALLAQKFSR